MASIQVRFESRDMADIAMSRLRRKGIAYKISDIKTEDSNLRTPFAPQYVANLVFPFTPPNITANNNIYDKYLNQPVSANMPSRSMLNAESIGLPLYGQGGEVHMKFIVNDVNRENTSTILRNSGGYDIKLTNKS